MKKFITIIVILITVYACKNKQEADKKELITTANSNLAVYKGEFIFTDGAAVLKGTDFIYGVVIDDKMKELAEKVAPSKKNAFDMVPVIVTGTVSPGPEDKETWDEFLTIIDIVQVSPKPAKADVKIKAGTVAKKATASIKKEEKK
tara:strand:- start:12374 stop:12811 length:438 start_codon:yes stop_codon:yes gene_type:complete